jgi:hypothetical protein
MNRASWAIFVAAGTLASCASAPSAPADAGPGPIDAGADAAADLGGGDVAGTRVEVAGTGADVAGADVAGTGADVGTVDVAGTEVSAPSDAAGGPAVLSADRPALMFANTAAMCPSEAALAATFTNVGGTPSGSLAVLVEGLSAADFAIEKDGCGGKQLSPGASCAIEVRFKPQVMDETAAAQLVVQGAAGESASSSLSGDSESSHFDVLPFMAGFLDFGTVTVGETTPVLEDVWNNNTDYPATPTSPMLTGDTTDFTVVTDSCSGKTIAPHQSCTIGVQLKATVAGPHNATFSLGAGGACGYDFYDTLTLIGTAQ